MSADEQRVEIEQLDAPITRRDVVNLFAAFESWGICEIMGHVRLAGLIREETVFGVAMVRVDVPKTEAREAYTRYFGAASLYGITPTSEETARYNAENIERYSSPVPYAPPRQLVAGEPVPADIVADEDDYDDEDDRDDGDDLLDEDGDEDDDDRDDTPVDEALAPTLTETEAHSLILRVLTEHGATDAANALPLLEVRDAATETLGRESVTLSDWHRFNDMLHDMRCAGAIAFEERALLDLVYVPSAAPAPAESGTEA